MKIFVNPSGQRENLGDSILRRPYLEALRTGGQLHVLVQNMGAYEKGLGLKDDDVIITSKAKWLTHATRALLAGDGAIACNTGEIVPEEMVKTLVWLGPLGVLARLRRRPFVLAGVAIRGNSTKGLWAVKLLVALSTFISWRDPYGLKVTGRGILQPDWALSLPAQSDAVVPATRDSLVVSVRGDRPFPSEAWVASVQDYAAEMNLSIITFAQVERDIERGEELARVLNGSFKSWTALDHDVQERHVRALYGRATAVVSDRIHCLIVGLTEGALAIAATPGNAAKCQGIFWFAHDVVYTETISEKIVDLGSWMSLKHQNPRELTLEAQRQVAEVAKRLRTALGA